MKKCLLSLLVIVFALVLNCGNEPPEGFYEGTPEDSAAIQSLLDSNTELLVSEDIFINGYIPVSFGAIAFSVADSYFRNDSTIIKRHCDSTAMELSLRTDILDFWFAKDTTCTVFLYDTFSVISLMHYDLRNIGYYFWGSDTDPQLDTVLVDTTDGYAELNFTGNGYRHIFFDRDDNGDWLLKRISYGTYYFPASSPDLPLMQKVVFIRTDGERDSIIASSYDTLYTGHIMNRFRAIDSLLSFANGEQVTVQFTLYTGSITADMCQFYASCGGNRVHIVDNGDTLTFSGTGIQNLCFEAILADGYYYQQPEKEFGGQMWVIPVELGGAQ
ncbi:hypothetical protein A2Y85_00405 [candidate division WOR-3 bacterium RBG_13_43_14]|uniref:Uncharacterized protein n=1 Tax=candidate division WOR-3 bacterium RBG_13_43_14 TaxID=1802590 RepID=A0A1F4UBI1_UNCW3|nr:MAG: hypothetical protein A2Y85_00405 [candidate division WOR-3 bacterium RBG_13_43_14]